MSTPDELNTLVTYQKSRRAGFTDTCPDCKGEGDTPLPENEHCTCEQPCSCYNYSPCETCDGSGRAKAVPPGPAGACAIRQGELLSRIPLPTPLGTPDRGKKSHLINDRLSPTQSVLYKNVIGTSTPVIIRPAPPISRWMRWRERAFGILDWFRLKWFGFKARWQPEEVDDPLYDLMNEDSVVPNEEQDAMQELAKSLLAAPSMDPTEPSDCKEKS